MTEPVDVLVVAAHPDDAEFGAAGTLAKWTRDGRSVAYVVCTGGEKGTSDPTLAPEALRQIREGEQRAAARTLGVQEVVFLGQPDQGLEDTAEFRKLIVRMIRTFRPAVVMTSGSLPALHLAPRSPHHRPGRAGRDLPVRARPPGLPGPADRGARCRTR